MNPDNRRIRLFMFALVLSSVLYLSATSKADNETSDPKKPPASSILREEEQKFPGKSYKLSLKEATELALLNNFDIQLAKYEIWIARTGQDVSESIYDTVFNAEVEYRDNQKRQTSTIFGTKTVDNDYNIGLTKKMPTGTTVSIDMTNNRKSTTSAFVTSSLTHDSALELAIKQELGKNFFGMRDRGNVKITQIDIENVEFTSLEKIEQYIAQTQKAYWNLVLEVERVKIEKDMVEQARRLYDHHQEQLKDGLVEKPEVIASEANYKRRQNELTLAQNRAKAKVNALKLLLNITDKEVYFDPTQNLDLPKTIEQLGQALKQAFDHRRDYQRAHNEVKGKDIALSLEKNNIWPEINLTASLARNGLGDHFKQAVTQISDEDNPNFFAGLEISFPLENSEARAQLKGAELEKAKVLLNLKFLEKQITIEIMDQVRDCNTFQDVAVNSELIAALQAQKLKEEENRFKRGRSDTDTLIRFQEDLIQDRLLAAQAKHRYHSAIADLQQKSGTLLNKYWEGEI